MGESAPNNTNETTGEWQMKPYISVEYELTLFYFPPKNYK